LNLLGDFANDSQDEIMFAKGFHDNVSNYRCWLQLLVVVATTFMTTLVPILVCDMEHYK